MKVFSNAMVPRPLLSRELSSCFRLLQPTCWQEWRKCDGGVFLFYDFTGSAAYACSYILIGCFFGKKWKLLQAWLGPIVLYLIMGGVIFIVFRIYF